jgi:hypothetical protein
MQQSEAGDFVEGRSAIMREASLQVSCIWCGRLHQVDCPLEFHPVCPTCTGRYPMGLLDMNGSYPLSHDTIDQMVSRTSPGNYALGYMDGSTFMVFYVGRSDSDVKRRLHGWVGAPSRYERYAPCAKAAWGSRRRRYRPQGAPALDRVGIGVDSSYTSFAYSYASSAEAAFEKECRNYHDFGGSDGLDNEAHPASTPGGSGGCPEHGE